MRKVLLNRKMMVLAGAALGLTLFLRFTGREKVDFSRDIKPILNSRCISCHGGVKAKGGFSVLFREEALAPTESGKPAIIPGNPKGSEMIRRIKSRDPEERMPYQHKPLPARELKLLTRWVEQGAEWGEHWAYIPVEETPAPGLDDPDVVNNVDRFIRARLKAEGLKSSPSADKPTLLRRVSLDLIGLLPDESLAKAYLENPDEKAYEILVDSLLASPHFGERWASIWLDLARYADSKGYEADRKRDIWEYRDWVIRAFNEDKPYDVFLTEQIAGDLLPGASNAQYIATGFSRNTMTNDEGGTDNEEFRLAAVMDRVNTTWEALMSTSFACVQCHSHPYDPFRHADYYRFAAYFNNTLDEDTNYEYPLLRLYGEEEQEALDSLVAWVVRHRDSASGERVKLFVRTLQPAVNAFTAEGMQNATMEFNFGFLVRNNASFRLKSISFDHASQIVFNYRGEVPGGRLTAYLDTIGGRQIASTTLEDMSGKSGFKMLILDLPAGIRGSHDVCFTYVNTQRPAQSDKTLARFDFIAFPDFPSKRTPEYGRFRKIYERLLNSQPPTTPVMVETPDWKRRATYVFERGNIRNPGAKVEPGVPEVFQAAMPEGAPANRLGLAAWLTDIRNPLVSRTIVNRLWEQLFGRGIVETLEDMGTQGTLPTHQDLLDHYAYRLMTEYQWSLKRLLKEFVMSATYRQSSAFPKEGLADPDNKFYSRGPRTRLSAEQLRDQHLCISGLISRKMFGPGVMPWQPEGIWNAPYTNEKWSQSKGEDQYRRAVYIFWKRHAPYPSLLTFDAVQRVLCTARRIRTNTPLQALAIMNDSAYMEMAQALAGRMQRAAPGNLQGQIEQGYRWMLFREIPEEKKILFQELHAYALREYRQDTAAARLLAGDDRHYPPGEADIANRAALVVVANSMLNLDEVIMKN